MDGSEEYERGQTSGGGGGLRGGWRSRGERERQRGRREGKWGRGAEKWWRGEIGGERGREEKEAAVQE